MRPETEHWFDRDHTEYAARFGTFGAACEVCEAAPPCWEVRAWALDDEPGGWRPLCEECYRRLRADPHHNPPGLYADAYVNLGAAL